MKKEQIDDFTKLNVDFENLDLDIRTSDDDHYYMEYKLEKNGKKDPLTWEDKDGELTLKESEGGTGGYFITYDLGVFRTHIEQTQKEDTVNINTASKEELMTLPGIGESRADAVIACREEKGSFTSIEGIKDAAGIGDGIFNRIKDLITVN